MFYIVIFLINFSGLYYFKSILINLRRPPDSFEIIYLLLIFVTNCLIIFKCVYAYFILYRIKKNK